MNTRFYKSLTQVLLAVVALALCAFSAHSQTIRIADNNEVRPAGPNVYSTLQAAIDAAQPDDIVYITPSVTSYGSVMLAKKITLLGVGWNTDLGNRTSTISELGIISSSDGINSVSGSTLKGFAAGNIRFAGNTNSVGTPIFDNITIEEIEVGELTTFGNGNLTRAINNLIIRNCHIDDLRLTTSAGLTNSKIYNNIIGSVFLGYLNLDNNVVSNNVIQSDENEVNTGGTVNNTLFINNLFSGAGHCFKNLDGATFNNNIFYGLTPTTSSPTNYFRGNTFSYNLVTAASTMPPPGTNGGSNSGLGNITGTMPGFVNVSSTAWSAAFDYSLTSGSAAKNAGSDGTDIGPTGGTYPINQNIFFGPTPMPLITELNTSGVIPQDQPLKTSIKATSY